MAADIRQRAQVAMRNELAEEAFALIVERGFDAVTADELAQHIGVSRATFFRYFPSKEDVALAAIGAASTDIDATLGSARPGETLWQLLRRAFEPIAEDVRSAPELIRNRLRIIHDTPALRSRLRERRVLQIEGLADVLSQRPTLNPLQARAVAAATFAAVDQCWDAWAHHPAAVMGELLDDAFASLAAASRS